MRIKSRQHRQHAGGIPDRAGQRTGVIQVPRERHHPVGAHPSIGGLQPNHSAQ